MSIIKTVYKGKYPELVDFEITADEGATLAITMSGGAVTLIVTATSFLGEYVKTDQPLLKKGRYAMKVGKTGAITTTPTITITY